MEGNSDQEIGTVCRGFRISKSGHRFSGKCLCQIKSKESKYKQEYHSDDNAFSVDELFYWLFPSAEYLFRYMFLIRSKTRRFITKIIAERVTIIPGLPETVSHLDASVT